MNNKNARKLIILIAAICLIAGIISYGLYRCNAKKSNTDPQDKLVITNLNVGKADAAVIQYNDIVGIIDTGTEEAYDTIDAYLKKHEISDISFLLLTHYDQDHIGSAVEIINNYSIGTVYLPDYESEKEYYPALMDCISGKDNAIFVDNMLSMDFADNISMDILPAEDPGPLLESDKNMDNDMSLCLMIKYGSCKFLFTGDIENDRISQMADGSYDLSCDWIKIPHHGVYDKKEKKLIEKASPAYAVISTSLEKAPDDKLKELIKENDIKAYVTMNGDITTICDGNKITINQ